jgi:hypothetical protein
MFSCADDNDAYCASVLDKVAALYPGTTLVDSSLQIATGKSVKVPRLDGSYAHLPIVRGESWDTLKDRISRHAALRSTCISCHDTRSAVTVECSECHSLQCYSCVLLSFERGRGIVECPSCGHSVGTV